MHPADNGCNHLNCSGCLLRNVHYLPNMACYSEGSCSLGVGLTWLHCQMLSWNLACEQLRLESPGTVSLECPGSWPISMS